MKPIKIGILGLGTVATGVASILSKNNLEIARRIGTTIEITSVFVRSLDRENPYTLPLTTNVDDILDNPEIDIVIELMGGIDPAKTYISRAIKRGKHVVTANKELIALHGNELFAAAQESGVILNYEAAVAGGIPIIKTLREGLTANKVTAIYGIINGTSNYILTEMSKNKSDFSVALKDAQALGYAEADPTYDIKGIDAAHKLTILTSIAFGVPLSFENIYTEGIDTLSSEAIEVAEKLGYTIKHLGIAKYNNDRIEARVHPTLVPNSTQFASINGAMNAVLADGNAVGPLFSSGAGAGSEPTASAVIADIIDIYKEESSAIRTAPLAFSNSELNQSPFLTLDEYQMQYLIRVTSSKRVDKEALERLLKEKQIAIAEDHSDEEQLLYVTQLTCEANIDAAIDTISSEKRDYEILLLRIENFA